MNQKEFERIAVGLRQQAVTLASVMTRGSADADDVAQDAMLKLWAVHDSLRDSSHAHRLIKMIVRQLAVDSFRRHRLTAGLMVAMSEKEEGSGWQPSDNSGTAPDGQMEADEDEEWLRQRIAALPGREMQVMMMRQSEQKSNAEIARIMGIGKASVATMLSAARKKIFNDLKKRNRQ